MMFHLVNLVQIRKPFGIRKIMAWGNAYTTTLKSDNRAFLAVGANKASIAALF
jgi:hypothetical protein